MGTAKLRLQPDTRYAFSVRGINAGEKFSAWSDPIFYTTTGSGDPTAPSGLSLVAFNNSLIISWTRSTDKDAAAYNVYLSTSTISLSGGKVTGLSPTYIVDGSLLYVPNLAFDTTYYVRIEALGKNGNRSTATTEVSTATPSTFDIDVTVNITGDLNVDNLYLASGAQDGYVLTSDAIGHAVWEPVPSGESLVVSLDDLSDVDAPSPASGDYLHYNGINWGNVPSIPDITVSQPLVRTAYDIALNYISTNLKTTLDGGINKLDTIQSIATAASPTFAGLTLSGLTAGRVVYVGASKELVDNAVFTFDGTQLSVSPDTDTVHTFGRAKIGYDGIADSAVFAHYDKMAAGTYALLQNQEGTTYLNSASSKNIYFLHNHAIQWMITAGDIVASGAARTISAAAGYDLNFRMGDAAGANKISFQSSTPATIAQMNSYGDLALGTTSNSNYRLYVRQNPTVTSSEDKRAIYTLAEVVPSGSTTATYYGAAIVTSTTAASSGNMTNLYGANMTATHYGSGTLGSLYGAIFLARARGAGNITTARGIQVQSGATTNSTAASTITTVYGVDISVGTWAGAGKVTTAYGVYINGATAGGAVTNLYGIYIDATIAGAVTLNYAIYNASTSAIYTVGDLTFAGASGNTITASSTHDLTLKMGDKIGANKILFKDSDGTEVASVNSDGNATFTSLALAKSVKVTTYTITEDDHTIICEHATVPFTVTLPAATGTGRVYRIKNIGAANVTVQANGAETIDGSNTQTLEQWDGIVIVDYNAAFWAII